MKKPYKEQQIYKLNKEELSAIQRIELDMLIEVDRICRSNNISYELDGGTLLGAVRHKGYIPWDDDIDIRMLRDDYDKFCKICQSELDNKKFFLQTYYTDPNYRFGYGKIVREGTVFERYHHDMLNYKKGLFLDIMPCDNLPASPVKKALYNFECFVIRKISYSPIGAKYEKKIFIRMIYIILSKLPMSIIRHGFDRLAYKYNNSKTALVRSTGWHDPKEAKGYLRRWMDETCDLEFENHLFPAPKDWNGYLNQLYGPDYMTPPPADQQVPKTYITKLDLGDL